GSAAPTPATSRACLAPLMELTSLTGPMFHERRAALLAKWRKPTAPAVVFADFARDDYRNWFVTGEAFGTAPSRAGEAQLSADGQQVERLTGIGAAHSGLVSTRLQG